MATIKIVPEELRDLAGRLDGYSDEIRSMADAIATCFASGTANFEGNTKNRFDEQFEEMRPVIAQKLPELLADFAEQLRKKANEWEIADRG